MNTAIKHDPSNAPFCWHWTIYLAGKPTAGGWEATEADAIDAARVMAAAIAEGDA
jgi:hypothetical protein